MGGGNRSILDETIPDEIEKTFHFDLSLAIRCGWVERWNE